MSESRARVSEAVARPVRSAAQMVPAAVVTDLVDSFVNELSTKQYSALFAGLTLLFGFLQVLYENHSGNALLRNVPPVEVPVVENEDVITDDDDDVDDDVPLERAPRQYGAAVTDADDHGHNVGDEVDDPYGDAR